jgi:phage shock protein A
VQAQGEISAAEDFITSRGAIGAEARTRLAEAGASSCRPVSCSRAIPHRRCRTRSGRTSWHAGDPLAQNDVGSSRTAGCSAAGGGDMMGAVLGGIVINSLLNGGGGPVAAPAAVGSAAAAAAGRRPRPAGFGGGGTRSAAEGGASDAGIRAPAPVGTGTPRTLTEIWKGHPMTKQSIFGRISTLVKANVNALIDSAEDPQKMIDQLVRDYTNNIADAESAIAETIGNLRLLERDHQEDVQSAAEWGNKALAASRKADELRGPATPPTPTSSTTSPSRPAASDQLRAGGAAAEPQIAAQTEVVDKLKTGLNGMKDKLVELKNKRSELLARQKSAEAQNKVHDAVKSIDVMDPTSELGRFEDKVRRQEASPPARRRSRHPRSTRSSTSSRMSASSPRSRPAWPR